jgi:hypothetical protein
VRAAPTLVRTWPLPRRRFIGDVSHSDDVLLKLGLSDVREVPDAPDTAR